MEEFEKGRIVLKEKARATKTNQIFVLKFVERVEVEPTRGTELLDEEGALVLDRIPMSARISRVNAFFCLIAENEMDFSSGISEQMRSI